MPRKRTGYDAACYYDGKLLGRCTKADSDAYTLLMNACGGEAARVLREYAYFSPELKSILEKAALMQFSVVIAGRVIARPFAWHDSRLLSASGHYGPRSTLCPTAGLFLRRPLCLCLFGSRFSGFELVANGRAMTRPAITTENCWAAVPKRTATPIPC